MQNTRIWEEEVTIPTYEVGKPDKNPMFLEKRVYQGSSGKVYPHSVIDKIYDERVDKTYKAVYLENEYLKVMVLPELGGRIQRAVDKTNHYDFIYYNQVIKPALVGLCGPWISGGIEFNWPQHHRPSTFDRVEYRLEEREDGSATVWVGEIENMFRTKGMLGITLYPDKAYIELNAQLYNRTGVPQTFLWWANPAVAVNDNTQSIFPPDVKAVMDHGKRDVSAFPIATGTYYKYDYSAGVDISRYKNIPVPTSYMAYHSDYDFVGGYDYGKEAGILHVADHHIAPGKKQWTWGCGEFGQAWDRNLTDEDGPYIELMTGCFTDNQPDFSWMAPYEEKSFKQYFMPYKQVGRVKNASRECALGLEVTESGIHARVYVTAPHRQVNIRLYAGTELLVEREISLSPEAAYEIDTGNKKTNGREYKPWEILIVVAAEGKELLRYQEAEPSEIRLPEPAKAAPLPEEVKTNEDLYLYGLHIEQYRHATYQAEDYYKEGLRRDATDIRINNAYGMLLLKRACFREAGEHFRAAVLKSTRSNPNPADGEPFYNWGLALKYLNEPEAAYDAFYKATWNGAWQAPAFYQLACIDCLRGNYRAALDHSEASVLRNYHNLKARNLKTAILRKLNAFERARELALESHRIDRLDLGCIYEMEQIAARTSKEKEAKRLADMFTSQIAGNHNTYIELAIDYREAGLYEDEINLLKKYCSSVHPDTVYPLVYYYLAEACHVCGEDGQSAVYADLAAKACPDYCFPHRPEDKAVLEYAANANPKDAKAFYYLGNLWYDKKQYNKAIECFETSAGLDTSFPTVHRNLALAGYNIRKDGKSAKEELEKAFLLDTSDARVFMELDQLYKKLGIPLKDRLETMRRHMDLVTVRDDLYLEYITLINVLESHEKAYRLIMNRQFHPWEGGEGKVTAQYLTALVEMAKEAMKGRDYGKAHRLLTQAAGSYPFNLGEGKLAGAQENNVYYYLGCACEKLADYYETQKQSKEAAAMREDAKKHWEKASRGLSEPAGMMYYNDQPPEMIFYQGMALCRLDRKEEAYLRFDRLIAYAKEHMDDLVRIDYFAVSLPDLMIFDEDLQIRNKIHCLFMMALGYAGKKEHMLYKECVRKLLELDPNHLGIRCHNLASVEDFE